MNQSFFIYIGEQSMRFDNLYFSIPNRHNDISEKEINLNQNEISGKFIIDDEENDLSSVLANAIISKLKMPIYLSLNIVDPLLIKDPMFILFLQENIIKLLNN